MVTQESHSYTELGDGICYWNPATSRFEDSQDLIEIAGDTAVAQRGAARVVFSPNANAPVVIDAQAGAIRLQSHVLGLSYLDTVSGKVVSIASVKDSAAILYPPNVLVFPDAFDSIKADIRYTYNMGAYEQDIVLLAALPDPATVAPGFTPANTRIQIWTAFVNPPVPQIRQRVLKPAIDPVTGQRVAGADLVDQTLDFGSVWFPLGAAYAWDGEGLPNDGEPVRIRVPDPSDPNAILVGKQWVSAGLNGQAMLIESADFLDLQTRLARVLKTGSLQTPLRRSRTAELSGRKARPMEVASGRYRPNGLVMDYMSLTGSSNTFTFTNNATYVISNSFTIGSGNGIAYFQNNTTVKFATNAYLLLYGGVSFPSSGAPAVFTSQDDNFYGQRITGSSGIPYYAASQAIWIYYLTTSYRTVQNALVRWSQRAIQYDENPNVYNYPTVCTNILQNCSIGVYVNVQNDTLTLSGNTGHDLVTPIYHATGYYSGSITTDYGIASVARVNDPNHDNFPGEDPDKNSQSECSFVLVDSSRIVAAFWNTHYSEYLLGYPVNSNYTVYFPGKVSARSTSWTVSTDGGASFSTNQTALPPNPPQTISDGDAGDPVMARDGGNGNIYLLVNPSREQGSAPSGQWAGASRLWISTDNGQSFSQSKTNIFGSATWGDRPAIAVNNFANTSNYRHVYAAALVSVGSSRGVYVTHSSPGGASWDTPQLLQTNAQGADIAIRPDGTVYVFYAADSSSSPTLHTNWIQYSWKTTNQASWNGPVSLNAHANSSQIYSAAVNGSGDPLWSSGAASDDYFISNCFARAGVNPANGQVYVVYADLPYAGSTTDRGDIFAQEGTPNSDGSLSWSGEIKVTRENATTTTDQWNPSIAVNPAGTELFIGYYSRQKDTSSNHWIMAYGAKATLAYGLANATFDTVPVSTSGFEPLFPGDSARTPPDQPWLFDHVWVQDQVWFDTNAYVVPSGSANAWVKANGAVYRNFCADDYTWASADGSYFYFAWCDRSDTYVYHPGQGDQHTRPDANIRLARIKP